jgi:hypothetical protein
MSSTKVRQYLRAHVLGLVAIFVALTGSAIGADGPTASSSVVTDAKFKKLKRKVRGLQNTLNSPVTGDVRGTFPNLVIGPNAVTTQKLANNAVTTDKLANNAVSTDKIADDAVKTAKIENDAVTTAKLAADSVGASEMKGVSTPQSGLLNIVAGTENVQTVSCGAGTQVLGGGALWDAVDPDLRMFNSFPSSSTSWTVNVSNQDGADHGVRATATCLAP